MSLNRNGQTCRHPITAIDEETAEVYCVECGDVLEDDDTEGYDTY